MKFVKWPDQFACHNAYPKSAHYVLCMQAVEKKLDEAQSDVLDQPLSKRAKGAQRKHPAGPPKEQHAGDGALAAKFL